MKISNIRLVSIVIVTLIFGVSCSEGPREISLEQLQQRSDGLYYAVNEDKPFSGVAVETYEDGQKSAEKSFEDGKLHGFIRAWYPDGNKKSEIGYDDGLQSGPFRTWYDNGQQEMEGDYKDGRRTGEWSFWNRDGQKLEAGKVTDIDGNTYLTIKIGDQWWMAENLKVTHYRNGEPIVHVTADSAWRRLSSGAYCSYGNDEDRADVYGRLYNYYAVADGRG
ncbi:MAG TPA: hypothetical protein ENO07_01230, partial [candidate division Zixibacteria bacterium]|nr:hypothetical protein [candidate division Zixibacteria bacterium]